MANDPFTLCKYAAADETVHAARGNNFNESVYVNFFDTRTKLGGILRTGNRPGLGYREFSVNLKLPGGTIAFRAGREESQENREFACGGLRLQLVEPTRRWRLTFRGSLTL